MLYHLLQFYNVKYPLEGAKWRAKFFLIATDKSKANYDCGTESIDSLTQSKHDDQSEQWDEA